MAGPQLVVPVLNARFLLNAANARWGSLYDALYGTDAIPGARRRPAAMIAARGAQVIAWAKAFLDEAVPLAERHRGPTGDGRRAGAGRSGAAGRAARRQSLLFRHNGLHIELVIDRDPSDRRGPIRRASPTSCSNPR